MERIIKNGYDFIANEYYSEKHITSKNFDEATFYYFNKGTSIRNLLTDINISIELGSGRGNTNNYLGVPSSKIILSDISQLMLSNATDGTYILKLITDARKTPFISNSFDLVTAFLFDPYNGQNLFDEIHRLLNINGIFVGTLPHHLWGETLRRELKIELDKTQFLLSDGKILETISKLTSKEELEKMLKDKFDILEINDIKLPETVTKISEHIKIPAKILEISIYDLPIVQSIILRKK